VIAALLRRECRAKALTVLTSAAAARPAHGQKSEANKVIDGPRPTVDFPSEHPVLLPVVGHPQSP